MAAPAPAPAPKIKGKKGTGVEPTGVDLMYTNTGAMDIIFGSDSDSGTTWIKEVKSSRLQPGMKLTAMLVDGVTKDLSAMPFNDVMKELAAQNKTGGGLSGFHLQFEPDLTDTSALNSTKLVRMEGKDEKEVIDVLEAINRGTERNENLFNRKNELHEQEKAKFALAEANNEKLQDRISTMEGDKATVEQQNEEQLRRVTALEREEAAAVEECRSQLRGMEDTFAKVNTDLKTEQTKNEELGKEFATQSGQLEAARKREVQAHDAQATLAKHLLATMEQVEQDEKDIQTVKSQSAGRGVEAFQLNTQLEEMKKQKEADDKEIETKIIHLREATAATNQAGQREETARTELGAKVDKLEALVASLNAKSGRQQESQKLERAAAASNAAAAEEERSQLNVTISDWETKHHNISMQHREVRMVMSLATQEIQGLKQQREDVQKQLAQQLKDQEAQRLVAAKEEADLRKEIDRDEAALVKQQKLAARDVRQAEETDRFHQNQMATSVTAKIRQITALTNQVTQLQEQLASEQQLRSQHESEVARLNKDVVAEANNIADLKVDSATCKATIEARNDQLKNTTEEQAKMRSQILDLTAQMQQQAGAQQAQLDDERMRANGAESMRTEAETKLESVTQAFFGARRELDDLRGQHNTTLSQISTLERRAKMQNAAAKTVSAVAQDRLGTVTQAAAVDAAEIQTLKNDYRTIHKQLTDSLEAVEQTQGELEFGQTRVQELNQEIADQKTASEKTAKELQNAVGEAQANEKDTAAKLASMGQQLTRLTEQHGKEALGNKQSSSKAADLRKTVARKDTQLTKAVDRVAELETTQDQTQTDIHTYLQQIQSLGERLADTTEISKACQTHLTKAKADLRAEKGEKEVALSELSQTKTALATAQAVRPVLDETKRKLDTTTAELAETKAAMEADNARTKESLGAELLQVQTSLTEENRLLKSQLATAQSEVQQLSSSKAKLASALAADETALAGDNEKIGQQAGQIKALTGQVGELDSGLAKEKSARQADAKATDEAKAAATKASDADKAAATKAAETAKAVAKKEANAMQAKLQGEAQMLSAELADTKAALQDATSTITALDASLNSLGDSSAAEVADLQKSAGHAANEINTLAGEYEGKLSEATATLTSTQSKLNASQSSLTSTKGLLEAAQAEGVRIQESADDLTVELMQEAQSHNETKDMSKSQLEDASMTIDRYAKEVAQDQAERDGLQDKLKDMERERMRTYARLAETQMVLLSKNKALSDSIAQTKKYRAMSQLRIGMLQESKEKLAEQDQAEYDKLRQEAMVAALSASEELEKDRANGDKELMEATESYLKAERVTEDQAMKITALESTVAARDVTVAGQERSIKELDDQCTLWRAKVRHRHRALEMPQFAKSKKGQKEKEEWMKQKALDDSLGFDDQLNQEITVAFDGSSEWELTHNGSLGLGLLNCIDHEKKTFTLVHSMAEVSQLCVHLPSVVSIRVYHPCVA